MNNNILTIIEQDKTIQINIDKILYAIATKDKTILYLEGGATIETKFIIDLDSGAVEYSEIDEFFKDI
jgi:hypothetical protein